MYSLVHQLHLHKYIAHPPPPPQKKKKKRKRVSNKINVVYLYLCLV